MRNMLLTAIVILLTFSCKKNVSGEESGTVRDYTGLDACGFVIVLDRGETLEPISFPAGTVLTDGRRVTIKYRVRDDRATACMAGTIVDILSLR